MTEVQFATLICAAPLLTLTLVWFAALAFLFPPQRVRAERREGGK